MDNCLYYIIYSYSFTTVVLTIFIAKSVIDYRNSKKIYQKLLQGRNEEKIPQKDLS